MELIFCTNCRNVFSVDKKNKKCECKQTSGYWLDGFTYYKGSYAVPLSLKDEYFSKTSPAWNSNSIPLHSKSKVAPSGADRDFCVKVIEYLNQVAGTSYSTKFPSSASSAILQRRKEHNIGIEEFKNVIDKKWADWNGTIYVKYMRPDTLFNKTKFLNYLGEKGVKQSKPASRFEQFTNTVQRAAENSDTNPGSQPG